MRAPTSVSAERSIGAATDGARQAAREASPWIEGLGRFGYAAKGVVYLVVGILAVQAALGRGGQMIDQQGALARIAEAPFGRFLLVVLTIGLLGYALWRFVQAAMDSENKGSDGQGLFARAGYAGVGAIYVGLALSAVRVLQGAAGNAGSSQQTHGWSAWLMSQPFGAELVGLVGAAVVGNGLFQLYRAYGTKFRDRLRLGELSPEQVDWVTQIGRIGYAARGVAFVMIGMFLVSAALQAEPSQARGLDGALAALAEQPYGPYLLGLVAAGLAAYGVFALIEARYRPMLIR